LFGLHVKKGFRLLPKKYGAAVDSKAVKLKIVFDFVQVPY